MNQQENYRFVGKEMPNEQAEGKVTGKLKYGGDFYEKNMLHVRLVHSSIAHGEIVRIETAEAENLPGVRKVYTMLNTPDKVYDRGRVSPHETVPNQERLFDPMIRFMGERVAAVAAESEEIAEAACRLIKIEYKTLPVAVTMEAAMAKDAVAIHPGGNIVEAPDFDYGDYHNLKADHVHQSSSGIGRMSHMCMECNVCLGLYDPSAEKLTLWTPCQTVFGVRSTVADFLNLPYNKVRVIKTHMGGSFGVKQETLLEPLVGYIALDLEASVRLVYSREEQIINTMMKHNLVGKVESKVSEDGTIQGLKVDCSLDSGAYQTVSMGYLKTIGTKMGKVYKVPNISYQSRTVYTNTPVNGSFRSWGSAEATLMVENHWNMVAKDLNIDPVEFRLKNIMQPSDLNVFYNVPIGNANFEEALTKGRDQFEWERRRQDCIKKNEASDNGADNGRYRYGVGMALSSHTSSFYPYRVDIATAAARIQEDGSVIINVGIHDHGCGTVLAMKKIAGEVLEMDLDKIDLGEADSQVSLYDYGCYASRTVYTLGEAVRQCCKELLDKAMDAAAAALGASKSFTRYAEGYFYKESNPSVRLSLRDVVQYATEVIGQDLYQVYTHNATESPGVAAAHFTELEVDTWTGMVKVLHCLSVHDVGRAINPDLCRGQVGSGIQQGIGMAVREDIKIHPVTGKTLISNFKNYDMVMAEEMPEYDVLFIEEPEVNGPFGAKSIGEVVVVPVPPAIVAAVNFALNTNLTHLPLSPAVILEEIERSQR